MLESLFSALAVAGPARGLRRARFRFTGAAKSETVEGLCIEASRRDMARLGMLCQDADCLFDVAMPNLLRTGEVCEISQRLFADGGAILWEVVACRGLAPGPMNVFAFAAQVFVALALTQLLSVCSSVRGAPGAASRRGSVALGLRYQRSPNCSEGPASEAGACHTPMAEARMQMPGARSEETEVEACSETSFCFFSFRIDVYLSRGTKVAAGSSPNWAALLAADAANWMDSVLGMLKAAPPDEADDAKLRETPELAPFGAGFAMQSLDGIHQQPVSLWLWFQPLLGGHPTLTFGYAVNQSLECIRLPISIQLPSSLQSLAFGGADSSSSSTGLTSDPRKKGEGRGWTFGIGSTGTLLFSPRASIWLLRNSSPNSHGLNFGKFPRLPIVDWSTMSLYDMEGVNTWPVVIVSYLSVLRDQIVMNQMIVVVMHRRLGRSVSQECWQGHVRLRWPGDAKELEFHSPRDNWEREAQRRRNGEATQGSSEAFEKNFAAESAVHKTCLQTEKPNLDVQNTRQTGLKTVTSTATTTGEVQENAMHSAKDSCEVKSGAAGKEAVLI
ncbi:unnamed protein product [Symbiodinium sp. CCMP2592]|nr:unnamed protein product [Symbiodinium sp. CCMP2592]